MNKHIFCSRKGGVRVSEILSNQILRYAEKMERREAKRQLKTDRAEMRSPPEHDTKAQCAARGRQLIELFVSGKIYSKNRRRKRFTINPLALAMNRALN